ncbi:MAG: protein-L-isoaspartate(D-aspartate) O-methyltransferase [Clostridiales bacterium]|nr:protein-L-isoaspartate(D-aspartate) O-methyltransferase [Clostridiales bacterium]MCF8023326.1 protein-L-isoaspartate(D-aspartate) O-methyltransferase [Clostridiales bacterium]
MNNMQELVKHIKDINYLQSEHIINAFMKVDRINFIPADFIHRAYDDIPLLIGEGQTISQPRVVAFMLELLDPREGHEILDVGFGSGWTTALMAEIAGDMGIICSIERIKSLKEFGENNVKKVGYKNVNFKLGNGSKGWPEDKLFDRILVSAAGKRVSEKLKEQLKPGGRLIMPLSDLEGNIILLDKVDEYEYKEDYFPGFAFVPLK